MSERTHDSIHRRAQRVDAVLVATSGLIATLVMTTAMYMLPLLGWAQIDLPTWIARVFVTTPPAVAIVGISLHVLIGLTWAWLFTSQIEPQSSLTPAATGLAFGIALWAFAQTIAVPLVGAVGHAIHAVDVAAPGWFALRLGAGPALSSLIAHIAYGVSLSLVYGRRGATSADGRPTRVWTEQTSHASASLC
jgi:hypothetical protein